MSSIPPLRWRPELTVVLPGEGDPTVWLFGGVGPVRLSGGLAAPVASAIDGRRTLDEVVEAAGELGIEGYRAAAVVMRWLAAGYLEEDAGSAQAPRVRVLAMGSVDVPALTSSLQVSGVEVSDEAPVTVVVIDDLLEAAKVRVEGTWIPVRLRGHRVLVGPVLGAGGGCPTCLVHRHRQRRSVELVSARLAGLAGPPPSPVTHPAAHTLAAVELAILLHGKSGEGPSGELVTVEVVGGTRRRHSLVALPGCAECDPGGTSVVDGREPIGATAIAADGGLRAVDPEVTWRQHCHLISDEVGVVPEVEPVGDPSLRVFRAGSNPAVDETMDLGRLRSSLRGSSMGKGTTESGARTGALAEALERHSMLWRGDEPHVVATMGELPGAIHPNDIQLYSKRQLDSPAAESGDDDRPRFHYVPRRFDPDSPQQWSCLQPLSGGADAWVPSALVWFGHPAQANGGPRACSNGAAAGNSVDEAILQGLLELVERDAVALWWYPRARRPGLDLDSCRDPRVAAALAPLRALGREVWVLDLTNDLGIPVAGAFSALPGGSRVLHGFGAHLNPVMAAVRAITEVSQMESMSPGDHGLGAGGASALGHLGQVEREWLEEVTAASDPWLAPHGATPLEPSDPMSLDDSVSQVLDRLESAGLSAYWANVTRRDIGLPVVRTFAPGLRHFWNRFAPGRLYDVPPALGWVDAGYGEDDLNPRWVFI